MNYQEKLEAVSLGQSVVNDHTFYPYKIMSIWEKSPSVHEVSLFGNIMGSVVVKFTTLDKLQPTSIISDGRACIAGSFWIVDYADVHD